MCGVGGAARWGGGEPARQTERESKRGAPLLIFSTQLIDVTSERNASFYCDDGDGGGGDADCHDYTYR